MLKLSIANACVEIIVSEPEELLKTLKTDFARRYLPTVMANECADITAKIYWLRGGSFRVLSATYSDTGPDVYVIQGEYPEAYVNESPVFFLVQVFARSLAKKGYVMVTDSVAMGLNDKNVLFLGFPHTGKSTMSSIAVTFGYTVYSTENTVIETKNGIIYVVSGTRVLVFDPVVRELYGVTVQPTNKTKHGYEVVDLESVYTISPSMQIPVDEIYVIYTSFSSSGVSMKPIRGRKIEKLLWYFATSLIKGMDYYYPQPLDMPMSTIVTKTINEFIEVAKKNYTGKFYEVFGSPLEVLRAITSQRFPRRSAV